MRERSQFIVEISRFPPYLRMFTTHYVDYFTLHATSLLRALNSYALAHSALVRYCVAQDSQGGAMECLVCL